jgi:large subunit ribosomal protein L21
VLQAGASFLEVLVFAVIRTGGKQYRVAEGDTVNVERDVLATADGTTVSFGDILMIGGDQPKVGAPLVEGAKVTGTVLSELRGEKIIVFKKKRTKQYKRKQGHRQDLVAVRIDRIEI